MIVFKFICYFFCIFAGLDMLRQLRYLGNRWNKENFLVGMSATMMVVSAQFIWLPLLMFRI